jgi:L-threonylcarbamoyladenylate synthase
VPSVVTLDSERPDPAAIERLAVQLAGSAILGIPTDTLYGLAVNPQDDCAVARLFELNGRDAAIAVPLVAADLSQVLTRVGRLTPIGQQLALRFWPGPLTLVINARRDLATGVRAADGSVAVRVPAHPVTRALARRFGAPLTATSANRSGQPPAMDAAAVVAALGDDVDVVVDAGPIRGGPPSTVVDVRDETPRLVRDGAIPWAAVLESLK